MRELSGAYKSDFEKVKKYIEKNAAKCSEREDAIESLRGIYLASMEEGEGVFAIHRNSPAEYAAEICESLPVKKGGYKKWMIAVLAVLFVLSIFAMAVFGMGKEEPSGTYEVTHQVFTPDIGPVVYSKGEGIDTSATFVNTSENKLWLSSDLWLERFDGENWVKVNADIPNAGTVMVMPHESVAFCTGVPEEGIFENIVEGDYRIIREIFVDENLSMSGGFAEHWFTVEYDLKEKEPVSFENADIGDIINFGNYHGDIQWLVLDKVDEKLFIIARDCIDVRQYEKVKVATRWDKCELRDWLNNDFIKEAFTKEEVLRITETKLDNPDNKRPGGAKGGFETKDKIFLLSHDEAETYFTDSSRKNVTLTEYAEKQEISTYIIDGEECWWWWLRSPGLGQDMATVVSANTGAIGDDGLSVDNKFGVRPAMWIYISMHEEEKTSGDNKKEENDAESPLPVQLGEGSFIPHNTGVIAGLFCNSEKTYIQVSSANMLVEMREILVYDNFINFAKEDQTEKSELGKALEGVDVVEFARDEDGKKYNLSLYENGFILNGSAVDDEDKGKIWLVEKEAWSRFKYLVKLQFEDSNFRNPYWLGLVNEKNIDVIWTRLNEGNYITYNSEMGCFELLVSIIKSISVEAPATKMTETNFIKMVPEIKGDLIHISIVFNTGTTYDCFINETELYIFSDDMKYSLYYELSEPGMDFNELYSFAVESENEGEANPSTAKPVIYLYPEKETEVSVKLDFDGKLTYTYPALDNGWKVIAKPDGTLTNLADGSTHYYLFWEGNANPEWKHDKGFVVKGSETEKFLRENLAKMGLTPREYNDFITYWVPKMQENEYNLISFSGEEYSEIAKLTVNPKQDSVIRIHMVWMGLDEPIEIEPQILPVYERKGFTLVEWGGTEIY